MMRLRNAIFGLLRLAAAVVFSVSHLGGVFFLFQLRRCDHSRSLAVEVSKSSSRLQSFTQVYYEERMQSRVQSFKYTNTPQVRGALGANKFGDPRAIGSRIVQGDARGGYRVG